MAEQLLDRNEVAARLAVSWRTVLRLRDAGKMPQPVRLGRSVRWRATAIDKWIADGCPAVSKN